MTEKRCSARNACSYLRELGVYPDIYWTYFYRMPADEAEKEFRQLLEMPIENRERDIMERAGMDGRVS